MFITQSPNKIYLPSDIYNKIKTNTIIDVIFMGEASTRMSINLIKGIVIQEEKNVKRNMQQEAQYTIDGLVEQTVSGTKDQFAKGNLIFDSISNLK
jgi:hypothetical protein